LFIEIVTKKYKEKFSSIYILISFINMYGLKR